MPPVPPVVPGPVVPAAPYMATAKDPRISAPLPFSGKSSELQNFLFAIPEYIQIKVNELPGETARLAFLTAMFSGNALDWWRGVTHISNHSQTRIDMPRGGLWRPNDLSPRIYGDHDAFPGQPLDLGLNQQGGNVEPTCRYQSKYTPQSNG